MQPLFQGTAPGTLAAHPGLARFREFLQREEVQSVAVLLLVLLIVDQIVRILAYWMGSKAVANADYATLGYAIRLWFIYSLFVVIVLIAMGVVLPVAAVLREGWRFMLVAGGTAMIAILIGFLIPMKIYVIGFLRALGLLLIAGIVEFVVMLGLNFAAVKGLGMEKQIVALQGIGGKTEAEKRAFLARLAGRDAPDEIDRLLDEALQPIGPRRSLPEREAAVALLQQKLEARRRSLPQGRSDAASAFQQQANRYMKFLNEVKAERSAQPARTSH